MSTIERVLNPYKKIISEFDADQQTHWAYWSGISPQKVVEVRNALTFTRNEINRWQNMSDLFTLIAVIVPLVVAFIVSSTRVPNVASIIDAVFPAAVAYVQKKLKKLNENYQIYLLVDNPVYRLMSDIIIDIHDNNYDNNEVNHKTKWDELLKITQNIEIL